ncbi:hypothetical protein PSCICG_15360 [Pseudomonas cichorii]|nr:hypothetical protein PSCICG_15360 [Pseudomonas cichorii]
MEDDDEASGLSVPQIGRYEMGTSEPRMTALVKLAKALIFSAVPFEGLKLREIILRISVITSDSQPALKLRWGGEEVQREEVVQEFKSVLELQIGEAASLALGGFSA